MKAQRKLATFVIVTILLTIFVVVFRLLPRGNDLQKELTIGERFHHDTSLTWLSALSDLIPPKLKKPSPYKNYPRAKIMKLPKAIYRGMILEDAIKKRRSVRDYSSKALTIDQLSQLLFAAQGITGRMYGTHLRTTPSAGALYPFEVYLIINKVQDLPRGIYHYSIVDHSLQLVKAGKFSSQITSAGLKQEMLGAGGVTFVLSAIFDRVRHKYGERGFRYIYIEAGHISQNISLQAVSLGLGSVSVGAFLDDEVNQLIGVDGKKEAVIYLHTVGSL